MKSRLKRFLKNPYVILLALIILVMVIDKLLSNFSFDQGGSFTLYRHGLEQPAAYNDLLKEFWFAETIAVIIFPFVLFGLKQEFAIKTRLLPWCIAAIIMFLGAVGTVTTIYKERAGGMWQNPGDTSYAIHRGAGYFPEYTEEDPLLDSMLPYFLRAQAPVVAGYLVTALGMHLYLDTRRKKS